MYLKMYTIIKHDINYINSYNSDLVLLRAFQILLHLVEDINVNGQIWLSAKDTRR